MLSIGPRSLPRFQDHEADFITGSTYPATMYAGPRSGGYDTASGHSMPFYNNNVYAPRPVQDIQSGFTAGHPLFTAEGAYSTAYTTTGGRSAHNLYHDEAENHAPSNLSSASAASAPSSTGGSPRSHHGQPAPVPGWAGATGLQMSPVIVQSHEFFGQGNTEYSFAPQGMEDLASYPVPVAKGPDFLDPSLIHPELLPQIMPFEPNFTQPQLPAQIPAHAAPYTHSPSLQPVSPHARQDSGSPFVAQNPNYQFTSPHFPPAPVPAPTQYDRRPSLASYHSAYSGEQHYSDGESKEKQKCPHPECGKVFKDLKAHMLTHQTERPEKCPIQTCDYHVKGFARKYDKNRHTLTHYKGTMVCGFCPGSGSAAEKSFNRADVFKRHLTAVHGVEQTPPNSRKKTAGGSATGSSVAGSSEHSGNGKLVGYASDATGKCSTCTQTFANAQDFYEHLDDCVLRIVQQEEPSEAINAKRLAEVENDRDVHATLDRAGLPRTTVVAKTEDDEDEELPNDNDDSLVDEEGKPRSKSSSSSSPTGKSNSAGNGVTNNTGKSRGLTHSRGGVPVHHAVSTGAGVGKSGRGRRNRKDFPTSWGFDKGQMTMKKRVMAVFDGQRRLAKDDMMLSTDHEVRVTLSDGVSYVTDLDVQTLKRADGFWSATEAERGLWVSNDPTEADIKAMMDAQATHVH